MTRTEIQDFARSSLRHVAASLIQEDLRELVDGGEERDKLLRYGAYERKPIVIGGETLHGEQIDWWRDAIEADAAAVVEEYSCDA